MKKNDIILLLVFLVLGGVGILFLGALKKNDGTTVLITVDGKTYGSYSLLEDQSIEVATGYGRNLVIIENKTVYVAEADCPDGYCVRHAAVGRTAEPIVCLPHKMVVEIVRKPQENGDMAEDEADGVAR